MFSSFSKKITKAILIVFLVAFSFSSFAFAADQPTPSDANPDSLVECGYNRACELGDIMNTANKLGRWIIRVIFPAVFFFALFMVVLPLLMNPNNPENRTKAKNNLIKLVVGTIIIVGAYFLVRGTLIALRADGDMNGFDPTSSLQQNTGQKLSSFIPFVSVAKAQSCSEQPFETCSSTPGCVWDLLADDGEGLCREDTVLSEPGTNTCATDPDKCKFQNPISDTSVQAILKAIMNVLTFAAVILIIMGIIRGVLYLVTSQERPDNLQKGKTWILWSLVAAALVFGAQTFSNLIVDTVQNVFN